MKQAAIQRTLQAPDMWIRTTNLINKRTPLLCGLLFAAILALLPILTQAQCANWDANVIISLIQPGSKPIALYLTQNGKRITGNAGAIVTNSSGHGEHRMQGQIDGSLDGDNFSVQIYWDNGQTGVYQGKVLLSGRLDGEAWEKRSPNVRLPWHTDGLLGCLPPPKPPPPAPIKSSGKAKIEPKPPPPLEAPWIDAGPAIFAVPGLHTGTVILTWDSGPDHPDAEVWLKTPNGAATVAKQVKGGLQLTVERGRQYEYILTDAGKILAGVTFVPQ